MEKKKRKTDDVVIREIPYSRKKGKISYDYPHKREPHELDFVEILARFGADIVLIKPGMVKGVGTPDCEWRGKRWEIKTIMNMKLENLPGLLKVAFKQSDNVILDLSKCSLDIKIVASGVLKYICGPRNEHGIMKHEILIIDEKCYCIINKKMLK